MNELLQKHGCSNVFTIPEGLKELMADISREVLRDQPPKVLEYIANYLSVLLITREHGILAVRVLDDLCDCRASVSEHLIQIGMEQAEANVLSGIIKEEIEGFVPEEGKEAVKESQILKKVLARSSLDEDMAARVCQVARNAYKDYWYRKKLMEKHLQVQPNEPWEIAAQRTLEIYKSTKPSYSELTRATQKIQAAYRGYYVRRNLQRSGKSKRTRPKAERAGPPLDVAGSRELDLGPVINLQVREEDAAAEFDAVAGQSLNLKYDPMKTITHVTAEAPALALPGKQRTKSETAKKSIVPLQLRKSTVTPLEEPEPELEPPSEVPLIDVPIEKRKSQFAEPGSRASSKVASSQGSSSHKISFADDSEEQKELLIKLQESQPDEIQEAPIPEEVEPAPAAEEPKVEEAVEPAAEAEIPEELPPPEQAAAPAEGGAEDAPEVPEEIPAEPAAEAYDSAPEADDSAAATDSAPLPSAASSAPATDVDTGGEEEGE